MNTNTSLRYLAAALAKATDPLHPNFARKLKPATLAMHNNIRLQAARAYDANVENPRAAIVQVGRQLRSDAQSYITFYKGLMSDVAFAAHMDCVQFERNIGQDQLDAGLDAMGEGHPVDSRDIPTYDKSDAQRAEEHESYEGGDTPEPIATSAEDAYAAVQAAQAWIGLAVSGMDEDQQTYWGVDGLFPLAQRKVEIEGEETRYIKVDDFDDYRELQTELYKAKRRAVNIAPDVDAAMLDS